MRETKTVEFKEEITNTFLKTVSAFSNYDGGEIYFGIDDEGNIKGLKDVKQACLDIENKVNASISPQPDYALEVQNNDKTIKLIVKSGRNKPYLYKSTAYRRNDTSTIEVDNLARFLWEDKYENDSYKCLCFRINGEVVQFNELFYEDKEEAKMVNAIYKVLDKVIPSQFDCILVDVSW